MLILGSGSPRRKEILHHFSLPFATASPSFDEDSVPFNGDPVDYVLTLSKGKVESLQQNFPDEPILGADTVVYFEGKLFGKPKNEQEAFSFLSQMSGKWHSVFTGMTLRKKNEEYQEFEEAKVLFNSLTEKQIQKYLSKLNWRDKAGGYAIQAAGGLIVRRIDGCYYNVMGLPVNALHLLLQSIGIDLWDFLK